MLLNAHLPAGYGHGRFEDDLERAAWSLADLLCDEQVRSLFLYALLRMSQDPDMRQVVHELERRGLATLETMLDRAKANGSIRQDVTADLVSYQLFGPIWHRTLLLQLPPNDQFISGLVAAVLRSITP